MAASPPTPEVPSIDLTGDSPEVPDGMKLESQLLDSLSEVPGISKLIVRQATSSAPTAVTLHMSVKNLLANNMRKYAVHTVLAADGTVGPYSMPQELPDALLISTSPKGNLQLVIKAGTETSSVVHQIWSASRLLAELQVPKTLHGSVYTDATFGPHGVAWSPDGGSVAYVAESPVAEKTPAWGGPESLKDAAGPKSWRGLGAAVEDWGELNTGKRVPQVFLLDLTLKRVIKVGGVAADLSCGQAVWTRDSTGLLMVGWPTLASNFPAIQRRLGMVVCFNRPSQMFHVGIARDAEGSLTIGATTELTPMLRSAVSPVFSPNGQHLVFLSHEAAVECGAHRSAAQLYKLPWPQALDGATPPQLVVDVVQDPATSSPSETPSGNVTTARPFPGLWPIGGLPPDAFIDNSTLLLTSTRYSQTTVLAVHIDSGEVTPITPVDTAPMACWSLLATTPGRAFAMQVAPDMPPRLMVAELPHGGEGATEPIAWTTIGPYQELPQLASAMVAGLEYSCLQVTPTTGPTQHRFETIVIRPRNPKGPLPTVMMPHGGPHNVMPVAWFPAYAFLAHLGYALLLPNFRGSTGFGQAALESLLGNVGNHDVHDCMDALEAAIDAGVTDPSRVAMCGASHGGFITGHLMGQLPDAFKCAIMRNPVCNLAVMAASSDIPDWVFVETYGSKEGRRRCSSAPTPDELRTMWEKSPVAHVSKVKAPILFLLGAKDRRVPMVDSLRYSCALKETGVVVRVLTFPDDTHALEKPQTDYESWMNIAWWLKKYL